MTCFHMSVKSLTVANVRAARPRATLWDANVRGLHLRVSPTGRKGYFFYYRTRGTRLERRPKIGDADLLSLEQARAAARDMALLVSIGEDPVAQRTAVRAAPDVRHLCAKYLWTYARRKKSRRKDRGMIRQYIIPEFGKRKVASVEYGDISALHAKLKAKPVAANRLLALLSKMFNLAERWKFRPQNTNPCRHVDRYPEQKRKIYMRDDEAPRIAEVLRRYEESRPQAVLFVYLLILSGARPDEIARARPEQVHPRPVGGVLELAEHKTDGTGDVRRIYLPPQVMGLIARTPNTGGTLTGIQSPKALWNVVRREADVPHLRLYDLRHTFASAALRAGHTLDQIGELLGHRSTQTTHRYAHLVDELAQEAAAGTAAVLERLMNATALSSAQKSPCKNR